MKKPFFFFFFKELIRTQILDIPDRSINLNFITDETDKIDIVI